MAKKTVVDRAIEKIDQDIAVLQATRERLLEAADRAPKRRKRLKPGEKLEAGETRVTMS